MQNSTLYVPDPPIDLSSLIDHAILSEHQDDPNAYERAVIAGEAVSRAGSEMVQTDEEDYDRPLKRSRED